MRSLVSVVVILLLLPLALASVSFLCETDAQCTLFLGEEVSCIESRCAAEDTVDARSGLEKFRAPEESPLWEGVTVERRVSIDRVCSAVDCITLAPPEEPLFLSWLLYAK